EVGGEVLFDELDSSDQLSGSFAVIEPLLSADEGDRAAGEEAGEPGVERHHGPGDEHAAGLWDEEAVLVEPAIGHVLDVVPAAVLAGAGGVLVIGEAAHLLGGLIHGPDAVHEEGVGVVPVAL